MQAIQTRFLGPTNVRGSRYKATAQAGSITLSADDRMNPEQNHHVAAAALVAKFGWNEHKGYKGLLGGQLPNGDYAWVMVDRLSVPA